MDTKTIVFIFFFCSLYLLSIQADEYDYEHQAKWYDKYKECSMQRQSPIELISNEAHVSFTMPAISFERYETPFILPAKCENNGHTINIQLPKPLDKLYPHIMGGPFDGMARYIAESVHFHWGSRDTHGSEHVIDGQRYAMEMHIVHRNSNYTTMEEAREHADGLAVIAVLFQVDPLLETDYNGLSNIISTLEKVHNFKETSEIRYLTLDELLKDLDTTEFFTYAGSLTTPPCSQAVTWLIFLHPIKIPSGQMSRFHHISDSHNSVLENNYRSLQPKGNREIVLRKHQNESLNLISSEDTLTD